MFHNFPGKFFKKCFLGTIMQIANIVSDSMQVVITYIQRVEYHFISGYVAPWSGRFYSLWDTGYAKIHIPIIASVSEHQPTTWVSFFFDLHILICTFPAGAWFVIKDINDERVFSEFNCIEIYLILTH